MPPDTPPPLDPWVLANTTKRAGQPVLTSGRYVVCDLAGQPVPDAEPVELRRGEVFPQTRRGLVWRLVEGAPVNPEDDGA